MNKRSSTLTRFGIPLAGCLLLATAALAQTSPQPGPTVPDKTVPDKMLPVPKPRDDMVINPTLEECKAGWRAGLKWTKERFDHFCAQLNISK